MSDAVIRIGGASGFWGDSSVGAPQLAAVPGMRYLVFDYLAELTMSILALLRRTVSDRRLSIVMVTHSREAAAAADRRFGIRDGELA